MKPHVPWPGPEHGTDAARDFYRVRWGTPRWVPVFCSDPSLVPFSFAGGRRTSRPNQSSCGRTAASFLAGALFSFLFLLLQLFEFFQRKFDAFQFLVSRPLPGRLSLTFTSAALATFALSFGTQAPGS